MTIFLNANHRKNKPIIGFSTTPIRLEELTDAQIEFVKLNWENPHAFLIDICNGVVTHKGIIRPGDLKRIAVRLALPKRPRPKTGEKLW